MGRVRKPSRALAAPTPWVWFAAARAPVLWRAHAAAGLVAGALALLAACGPVDFGDDADAGAGDADPGVFAPERYPADRVHSPITPFVAETLHDIAGRASAAQPDVFAKLGDAATMSTSFAYCFDDGYLDPAPGEQRGAIDLDGRDELKPTIELFRAGSAAGVVPFSRASRAAGVTWTASEPLAGDPSPLARELAEIAPAYAIVAFGTRDLELDDHDRFGGALLDATDALIAAGVVPILFTALARGDDPALDARVPRYNAVIRAVAQARQVPLIDQHRALAGVAGRGLGPDGIHPSVYRDQAGEPRACAFDADGLTFGYNTRNLLAIEALHRVTEVLVRDQPALDPGVATQAGDGSPGDPFAIPGLPYAARGDTSLSDNRTVDSYPGCNAGQDESGPEQVYRFDLDRPATIRAMVVDRGATDVDVHLLADRPEGEACIARAHLELSATLDPGTYYLIVDTFVSGGEEFAGEYLLAVVEE